MHFSIDQILYLLKNYGYLLLFVFVIIEGPFVTILSGILSTLGYFNFLLAYLVVMAGDLTGDVIFYVAGRWWFKSFVNKKFRKLEEAYRKHKGKIMFFGKLSSFAGSAAMMAAGAVAVPFDEFFLINFAGTIFKSLLLLLIGYFFGGTLLHWGNKLGFMTDLGLVALTLFVVVLYFVVSKISQMYLKKLEEDQK